MFEELKREIGRLQGQRVSVVIPSDPDGYLDRECPAEMCLFPFKVHEEDWRDKVRDEEVFCPFCGHVAPARHWATREQAEHVKAMAVAQIQRHIGAAMKRDANRWNQRQPRNSFVSLTMKVNDRPHQLSVPAAVMEPMRLKVACPACSCRYAVIGSAFFCPACGHNAADIVFGQSLSAIRRAMEVVSQVRTAIADADTAATTVRLLVENGLQNAVTAFQRYAEALYARFPSATPPRRNAFQNLAEGSTLWQSACGNRYSDHLEAAELEALTRFFQRRHLLAHTQGLVDEDYLTRTRDTEYRIGQRIVVRDVDVRHCVALIETLSAALAKDVEAISPTA